MYHYYKCITINKNQQIFSCFSLLKCRYSIVSWSCPACSITNIFIVYVLCIQYYSWWSAHFYFEYMDIKTANIISGLHSLFVIYLLINLLKWFSTLKEVLQCSIYTWHWQIFKKQMAKAVGLIRFKSNIFILGIATNYLLHSFSMIVVAFSTGEL